jgi:hypothetical protein
MLPSALMGVRTDVLGGQHGSVGRGLVTVGLDLHATGDTGDGFAARQIGDVDEGVVEGSEDTGNAENKLALLKRSIRVPTLSLADSTCLADLGSKLLQSLAHVHIVAGRESQTWMFSCAPRSTFFLGGMLTVELVCRRGVDGSGGQSRHQEVREVLNCVWARTDSALSALARRRRTKTSSTCNSSFRSPATML